MGNAFARAAHGVGRVLHARTRHRSKDYTQLMRIVRAERLARPVIDSDGPIVEGSVVMQRVSEGWRVYTVGERGGVLGKTLQNFERESDALTYVLDRLRVHAEYERAMRAFREQHPETQ